ncbi:MAG: efflux transporter outer membrane subunit [Syntrophobacterales bacterium]|nr:efflux transporter outer membrane subunit [Syntrophobacterales bacterium]
MVRWVVGVVKLATVVFIYGCFSVGPDYVKPEISLPKAWRNVEAPLSSVALSEDDERRLAFWWKTLGDPELVKLIGRAIQGNLDIAKAYARIREARARRGIALSSLFPSIGSSFSSAGTYRDPPRGYTTTEDLYTIEIDTSWELDIFGKTRRAVEAAERTLEATQEELRNVLVSLTAEVALAYVETRTYQNRLAVAEENLTVQEESLHLASWRYEAGLSDELAVQQARYNFESTRSQIPLLRTGVEEAMNRLAVLLGEPPGSLKEELKNIAPLPSPPKDLVVGIPADLLRRRPDIRKAERELAAQVARVGIAEAELYPSIALSGTIGIEALSPGGFFSSATKVLIGRGILSFPIFRGGALKQALEVERALVEQALATYRLKVLQALEEVENALKAYSEEQGRYEALVVAEMAAKRASELANHKYASGLVDFGSVLEAQRSHLAFQDELTRARGAVISNLIRLYRALGGGWEVTSPWYEVERK